MLQYNEIKPGVAVIVEGEPYVCTWNNIMQKQQRRPVNQTKLRHLMKGNVIEHSFQQSDKLYEAEIESRQAIFIYERKGEWWFNPVGKPQDRFMLDSEIIGNPGKFLKTGMEVTTQWFEEKLIRVQLPIKVTLKVKEAPPNTRGNTAQGGSKVVTLETGADINAPMFINAGDTVIVNTETGDYVERA
jgi:elongation factor P